MQPLFSIIIPRAREIVLYLFSPLEPYLKRPMKCLIMSLFDRFLSNP